jgi:type III restriction enzyme
MALEFKFEADQEYQLQAIAAVTDLFEGQPFNDVELFTTLSGIPAVSNRLDIDDAGLLANLRAVQTGNGLPTDDELRVIESQLDEEADAPMVSFPNFSIEMETGTGKTYVYLRTALELYNRYGFRKFIVVVPSVAIREGVIKTLQQTERHFRDLYSNLPYRYYEYNSKNLSQLRQFALSDSVEIMVMTLDAFNKDVNVIRQSTDRLQGETPIHLVQASRPILILDEPQTKMESEKSKQALTMLAPLFALRYSATHRDPYNQVYRLTPFDAYRQNLVKRIEVASVIREDDANKPYIELKEVKSAKQSVSAKLDVQKLLKSGATKIETVKVEITPRQSKNTDLYVVTDLQQYADYVIDEIDVANQLIVFTSGVELRRGEALGADREAIIEAQIQAAIREHFVKQKRYRAENIKVLSLFFVDRVASYRTETGDDGFIRQAFDRQYRSLAAQEQFKDWAQYEPADVQAAYFYRTTKKGQEVYEDTTGTGEKDAETYDLIMRDKERLLSFDEPVAFIFSHSALIEGWDNPNIFQLCALRQVGSEVARRQMIGRGVRLPLNQSGDRIRDEKINVLTVIASEDYQRFVASYQTELIEEYGAQNVPPPPPNKGDEIMVRRNEKHFMLSPEFKELWERIKHKTRYAVSIDTGKVVEEVTAELQSVEIAQPRITVTKADIVVEDTDELTARQKSASRTLDTLERRATLPNLIQLMLHLMEFTTPKVTVSRGMLLRILSKFDRLDEALNNPQDFATKATNLIKEVMADHLVNGIQYTRLDDAYEMALFDAEYKDWLNYLVPVEKSVYDHVRFQSDVEKKFVEDIEARDDVRMYIKLPDWFKVPTPVGDYNPDWALVIENPDGDNKPLLYLVRETKGEGELRPTERRKTVCGEKHFVGALGTSYRVITEARELP